VREVLLFDPNMFPGFIEALLQLVACPLPERAFFCVKFSEARNLLRQEPYPALFIIGTKHNYTQPKRLS